MHGQVEFGKRLSAAAELVRPGAVFADIGTDHASLPIYLASLGRIKHAYACDVAEKPVAVAERNIAESGFSHLIDVRLTDGFCGLEGLGITDAALTDYVCNMVKLHMRPNALAAQGSGVKATNRLFRESCCAPDLVLLAAADRNGRITTQKATDDAAERYLAERLQLFLQNG